MSEKLEITVETITRRRGVSRLARAVGRNHSHISRVLSGERDAGPDLARKLKRLGIECERKQKAVARSSDSVARSRN